MRVFISYSHIDSNFATDLTRELFKKGVGYWMDNGEITVGESLSAKIIAAIEESTHFIAILSKNYFESKWCKDEFYYALKKQNEEQRQVIIPIVIDTCNMPDYVQDMSYVNAKDGFETAKETIFEIINRLSTEKLGRKYDEMYTTDWALEWQLIEHDGRKRYLLEIDAVSIENNRDYSIITNVEIIGNDILTKKFLDYNRLGRGSLLKDIIIDLICIETDKNPDAFKLMLEDSFKKKRSFSFFDKLSKIKFDVTINVRRIGPDNGKDTYYYFGSVFQAVRLVKY